MTHHVTCFRLLLLYLISFASTRQEHVPAAGIKADAPVVGLVLQKSHINTKDECHYVALIAELEARGAKVRSISNTGKLFRCPPSSR